MSTTLIAVCSSILFLHELYSGLLLLEHAYHSHLSGISCLLHGLYSGLLLEHAYHSPLSYIYTAYYLPRSLHRAMTSAHGPCPAWGSLRVHFPGTLCRPLETHALPGRHRLESTVIHTVISPTSPRITVPHGRQSDRGGKRYM